MKHIPPKAIITLFVILDSGNSCMMLQGEQNKKLMSP